MFRRFRHTSSSFRIARRSHGIRQACQGPSSLTWRIDVTSDPACTVILPYTGQYLNDIVQLLGLLFRVIEVTADTFNPGAVTGFGLAIPSLKKPVADHPIIWIKG